MHKKWGDCEILNFLINILDALDFLKTHFNLHHLSITPSNIVINVCGDFKITNL